MSTAPIRGRDGRYMIPKGTRLPDGNTLKKAVKLLSVTTINAKGMPKGDNDGLTIWAAGEAGKSALEYLPALVRHSRLGPDAPFKIKGKEYTSALRFLQMAATRTRDEAANFGGHIHDLIEAYVLGKPFPEPSAEHALYAEAFHNFLEDEEPDIHATELIVANLDDKWAGTIDVLMTLPRHDSTLDPPIVVGDWKTGKGDRKHDQCEWPSSGLQQAGYSRAQLAWDKSSGQQVDLPKINQEVAYIIHLRPDHHPGRGYGLCPVDISEPVYRQFLSNRSTAEFQLNEASKIIGKSLPYRRKEQK